MADPTALALASGCGGGCIEACLALYRGGEPVENIRRSAKCQPCRDLAERVLAVAPVHRQFFEQLGLVDVVEVGEVSRG